MGTGEPPTFQGPAAQASDSRPPGGSQPEMRRSLQRGLQRGLLVAALACFALPFLTVTCYGETTVSGVQAATKIDLYAEDDPGERELMREEPLNGFAFIALAEAAVAAVFSFRRARAATAWAAAAAVIALQGLFVYAFDRSWGEAWPRIGFVGAMTMLLAAAWLGARSTHRWVFATIGVLAVTMLPSALADVGTLTDLPWLYMPIFVGGVVAVALAVGAFPAAVRDPVVPAEPPSPMRIALAGTVGLTIITAAAIVTPVLLGVVLTDDDPPPGVPAAYAFAVIVLAILLAASALAWKAGRTVLRFDGPTQRSGGREPRP